MAFYIAGLGEAATLLPGQLCAKYKAVFSFHTGNWYWCMSLSLYLHPPKMHRNDTRDWQQGRKRQGYADWQTICQQKTRDTLRISMLQSSVNLMLLLQCRLVQTTLNEICIWLNYCSQSLLEKRLLSEEGSDPSIGNTFIYKVFIDFL